MNQLVPVGTPGVPAAFSHVSYTLTRPFWQFFGRKFRVHAPDGTMVAYAKHPIFRLRDQLTIYSDESETQALLHIRARQIVAINLARDVYDAGTGALLGTIRSRGLKSIIRDTWDLLDAQEQPVGTMVEEGAAILRRFFKLIPGKHKVELGSQTVATIRQRFRFFTKVFDLDISMAPGRIDPKFAIALGLIALMADAQREDRE